MANVTDYINKIKTAVFGKEVRGSLADGLDVVNKEVEGTTKKQKNLELTFNELTINAGNSNAEIVDARVDKVNSQSYNKLGDRLDGISSSLETIKTNVSRIAIELPPPTGIDDTQNIQKIIDSATSCTTIIIPTGTYIATTIRLKNNITLQGNGGILKFKDNTCISNSTDYFFINGINCNNVTIDSVIVDGNKTNNTQFNVADSITISGENNKVINCTILNSADSGIMFSKCSNSIIDGNRIDVATDVGIYVNDGDGTKHFENIIINNKITNCLHGAIACKRITQRLLISQNVIYNCGNGITLEHASSNTDFSKNITISNNQLRKIGYIETTSAKRGINLRCSNHTIVSNNKIEDCEGQCITLEGTDFSVIQNNIINCENTASKTLNIGINIVDREQYSCNNNLIQGNIITNAQFKGIWINNALTSKYNIIRDNIVNTIGVALRVQNTITESIIQNNILDGGELDYEDYGATESIISNNKFKNNKFGGSTNSNNRIMMNTVTGKNNKVIGISHSINGRPNTGTWKKDDIVLNMDISIIGEIPNRYIIYGWKRLTDGDTHIVGNDWIEIKVLIDAINNSDYSDRIYVGNPNTIIPPRFLGQEVIDTANKKIYKAIGMNNTDWKEISNFT